MGAYLIVATGAVAALVAPADRAGELEQAGRYGEAEPLRRTAYDQARRRGASTPATADRAEELADNLAMQIRLADAEPLYRLTLEIRLKRHGEMHSGTARSLRQLSGLLLAQGNRDEAENVSSRALTIQRAVSPAEDIEIAWALNALAQVRGAGGRPFDADPLYREAITVARATNPRDEDALAVLLNNRGTNLYRMAVAAQIPPAFRRAVGTSRGVVVPVEGDTRVGDPDRRRLLMEGRTVLREALALSERVSGADHPDAANLLNGLAANYQAAGEMDQAETLFRRALAIKLRFLQPADRDRIVGSWSLGAVLARIPGREGEARSHLRAAATGAIAAQGRHREFDRAASAELRSYTPVFVGQVRVNWTLANPR